MDDNRFDQVTRRLASRRTALGLLAGVAALGTEAATAKRRRRKRATPRAKPGPKKCTPNKACAQWCAAVYGADTPGAGACTSQATRCQGLCGDPTSTCAGRPDPTTVCCTRTAAGGCDPGKPVSCCPDGQTCRNGTCAASCLAPDPASNDKTRGLQTAIDAATPGATLVLCAGTWAMTTQVSIDKTLTLTGAGPTTILDGQKANRVLRIAQPVTVVLSDLTVRGGNTEDRFGGGIANFGTLLLGAGSTVSGNTAEVGGGGIFNQGTLTLRAGSTVSGNRVTGGGGGGILNEGTLTLEMGSTVRDNTSFLTGGGIYNAPSGSMNLMDGTIICGNSLLQCRGVVSDTSTGTCPSTPDGTCPIAT
jgi:predicted outer membrane repeat protein